MTTPGSDRAAGGAPQPAAIDNRLIVRAGGALWRTGDFGVVVLGTNQHDPVTLVGTGVDVWDVLERPRPQSDLVELLAARYGADREQVASDVAPLLDRLLADGALEVVA